MSGLQEWLLDKAGRNFYLYIKRLSANDTGATGGHQVGLYIPSVIVAELFPSIDHILEKNPSVLLHATYSSHACADSEARAIYYNNKYFGQTRNEKRITRWGRGSPLQDPENTGALTILAFEHEPGNDSRSVDVWVCSNPDEEDVLASVLGEVIPGTFVFGPANEMLGILLSVSHTRRREYKIPESWVSQFPTGSEIIQYAADYYKIGTSNPDEQLLERRSVEFDLFLKVEEIHVLDIIRKGFGSVDEFIAMANSVSNRRKSRAGKSLELHLEQLFLEHGLKSFETQCITEGKKKPDFIFPSSEAYHNDKFPDEKLRMLAVKTTCKDRWRQVLNEANRITCIHLFTLQEGVSLTQFKEMQEEGIRLVVPSPLHSKYPESIRGELITLGGFIAELIGIYQG
ncbi:type II restriction endonuclease [Klebsiella oxytoca]|uniref:type II restriction endonuclease n=1 Tax=Klebsiella oxytoca TaxID=571 RepID=UPI001F2A9DB9|nr:type II restriction endonuclease [Klebsiella oxytoca]MCE5399119.1 type II restriction endonuclease [Klebsiella oxytoca]